MQGLDAIKFWNDYIYPIIPNILSDEKWYSFSLASLRTMEEIGLAQELKNSIVLANLQTVEERLDLYKKQKEDGWVIQRRNYILFINEIGDLDFLYYPISPNFPNRILACKERPPRATTERFVVSLPKISFHS